MLSHKLIATRDLLCFCGFVSSDSSFLLLKFYEKHCLTLKSKISKLILTQGLLNSVHSSTNVHVFEAHSLLFEAIMNFTRQYNHEFKKLYRLCSPLNFSCWSPSVLKIMNTCFFQALCFISIISFCLSRFYLGFMERHGLVWGFLVKERGEQWPLPQSLSVACFIFPKPRIYPIKNKLRKPQT